MKDKIVLALVVPCYNEEEVLESTNKELINLMNEMIEENSISNNSYIMYVDDGSKDQTWSIIKKLHNESKLVQGVKLSRNRGHQNAVMAGLTAATNNCDAAISIDADLQDDIQAIKQMVERYREGDEIVLGVRNNRDTDTAFKRLTAEAFYKMMNKLGAKTVRDHADFRLIGNRALNELQNYKEVNLFLRGIVLELGFKTSCVYYKRGARMAGESKYPLSKMLGLAFAGITSFSVKPIRMILGAGIFFVCTSIAAAIAMLVVFLCGVSYSAEWLLIILDAMMFATGLIMLSIGLVGEYAGRTYMESKHRPRFIIEEHIKH